LHDCILRTAEVMNDYENDFLHVFCLNLRDQALYPYSSTDKITVLYILIFRFFDLRQEDERSRTER